MFKSIKRYFKNKKLTRQLSIALGVLKGLDMALRNQGNGRQRRREYWRKFISQHIVDKE